MLEKMKRVRSRMQAHMGGTGVRASTRVDRGGSSDTRSTVGFPQYCGQALLERVYVPLNEPEGKGWFYDKEGSACVLHYPIFARCTWVLVELLSSEVSACVMISGAFE